MKLYAVLFGVLVPFFAFTDACLIFYVRAIEGFDLVREMWDTE
jgi:hypothetical protein